MYFKHDTQTVYLMDTVCQLKSIFLANAYRDFFATENQIFVRNYFIEFIFIPSRITKLLINIDKKASTCTSHC